MKNLTILLFAAIALTACGGRGKSTAETRTGGMVIALSDSILQYRRVDTIEFGRVRAGEMITRDFVIKNSGDKALVITQLDLSCGCVKAEYPREPLMPGAEAPMTLTLDTHDLIGWVFKSVGVRTSLGSAPYTLYIIAEVERQEQA